MSAPDGDVIATSIAEPVRFAAIFDRHVDAIRRFVTRRLGFDRADDVPIGCGSIPPRDEPVDPPVSGSTPGEALAAFVEGNGLWRNGWTDTSTGPDAVHRFEYRRDDGLLVTVVYVEPAGAGWAVTRWLTTPC